MQDGITNLAANRGEEMCQRRNAIDRQSLTRRGKIHLTRAFAVLYVASVSVCGSIAAIAATGQPAEPISAPATVVFIGDSISAIWGSAQAGPQFAEHPGWIDKGVSGQTSSQVLARFQTDVIGLHPQIVHILVGTNDVYPGWTLEPSADAEGNGVDSPADVEAMVQMAQANNIHVILATIPPWGCDAANCTLAETADPTASRYDRINIWNAWIEEYALSQGIPVVDYHSALLAPDGEHYVPGLTLDGVHPSAAGYLVMTPMVENVIDAIASLYANK
jgi:lysophospholipase L1-like esterase